MHGVDRIWRHPTSRSPSHWVPNLCDHPWSSAPGLLLLPWFSSLHAMPHLPHAHHETSKTRFSNETKNKGKTTEMSWILIQTKPSQWLITIKPRSWPLSFSGLISPACDRYIQYLLTGPTHRSLIDTGGGYNLKGVGFPLHTPRPYQPTVLRFPPKAPRLVSNYPILT
jgi:hypothetical protein